MPKPRQPASSGRRPACERQLIRLIPRDAKEVGCWSHAKRKFDDAKDSDPEVADKALETVKKLYDIEAEARLRKLSDDDRQALRQERAPPLLVPFRAWLQAEQKRALPKSPTATAVGYVLNQWDALIRYVEDCRLEIDNNRSERALRPIAIGRKNDLLVFNEKTGKSATVLMSLVESCKAIGLDPTPYLNDVLQAMRHNPHVDPADLTPWAWKERCDQNAAKRQAREQAIAEIAAAVAARH